MQQKTASYRSLTALTGFRADGADKISLLTIVQ